MLASPPPLPPPSHPLLHHLLQNPSPSQLPVASVIATTTSNHLQATPTAAHQLNYQPATSTLLATTPAHQPATPTPPPVLQSTMPMPPHQPSLSTPPIQPPTTSTTSSVDTPWTSNLATPHIHPFAPSTHRGPTIPIHDSPLGVFRLFYTTDLVQHIVDQSNRYAEQVMSPTTFQEWTPLTPREFEAFVGFNILMGINHLPSLEDYWKRDDVYNYHPISSRISRDRFREIARYLHYVDNTTLQPPTSPTYDKLGKVRPLLAYLQGRFSEVYTPGRELAVDEAMIKFQGRSSLKQYMPKKPIKRGIKVWVLADSHTGFFSQLEVYTGKKGNTTEVNLGARVVKDLTMDFRGKWHRVFFDNFFTSKTLLCELEAAGIYGCGTARSDRRLFPEALKKPKLKTR